MPESTAAASSSRSPSEQSVRDWLGGWGAEVAAVDFDTAEPRFRADVVGYGTRATVARGLDALRRDQWSHVWPAIGEFAFDVDGADVWISPDEQQAVIGAPWSSVGFDADGHSHSRDGRATIVLVRDNDSWVGVHTHFSLAPIDPGTYTGPDRNR